MHILYSMQGSGNCYKLRLALKQTNTAFHLHDIDVLKDETRTPEFLAKNPNGKVPLLELSDGRFLPESNAGLYYLASGTPLLPENLFDRAQVLQWMFFEQYSHEPFLAVARYWWTIAPGGREEKAGEFENWRMRGYQALDVMERHLVDHDFFRCQPVQHRRYSTLRLYPCGARRHVRPVPLQGGQGLAGAGRPTGQPCRY